jgi:hypothetical protein
MRARLFGLAAMIAGACGARTDGGNSTAGALVGGAQVVPAAGAGGTAGGSGGSAVAGAGGTGSTVSAPQPAGTWGIAIAGMDLIATVHGADWITATGTIRDGKPAPAWLGLPPAIDAGGGDTPLLVRYQADGTPRWAKRAGGYMPSVNAAGDAVTLNQEFTASPALWARGYDSTGTEVWAMPDIVESAPDDRGGFLLLKKAKTDAVTMLLRVTATGDIVETRRAVDVFARGTYPVDRTGPPDDLPYHLASGEIVYALHSWTDEGPGLSISRLGVESHDVLVDAHFTSWTPCAFGSDGTVVVVGSYLPDDGTPWGAAIARYSGNALRWITHQGESHPTVYFGPCALKPDGRILVGAGIGLFYRYGVLLPAPTFGGVKLAPASGYPTDRMGAVIELDGNTGAVERTWMIRSTLDGGVSHIGVLSDNRLVLSGGIYGRAAFDRGPTLGSDLSTSNLSIVDTNLYGFIAVLAP